MESKQAEFMVPANQTVVAEDEEILVGEVDWDGDCEEILVQVQEGPATNKTASKEKRGRYILWEFLFSLLQDDLTCPRFIHWVDINNGTFKIANNKVVTKLWGISRKNPNMTYDSFSRCLRYYYGKNILEKVTYLTFSFRKFPRRFWLIMDGQTCMLELDKDKEEENPVEEVQPLSVSHPELADLVQKYLYKKENPQQKIQPKSIQITPDGRVAGLDIGIDCYSLLDDEEPPKEEPPKRVVKTGKIWYPPVGIPSPEKSECGGKKQKKTVNGGNHDEGLPEGEPSKPPAKSKEKPKRKGRKKIKVEQDDDAQLTVIIEKDATTS